MKKSLFLFQTSSINVSLDKYMILHARTLVYQRLFFLQTHQFKQHVNFALTGQTDWNLEVSSEQLISQKYFWAQVRNQTYRTIGIETCTYLDESNKKGRSIIDDGSRPLCKNVLKYPLYYTTNHKMVITWW